MAQPDGGRGIQDAIDTAVGVVMASSSQNVKLRDVAASVIASIAPDPSVAPHFDA